MGKRIKMWCRSCQVYHIIDDLVPLNKQLSDHTWGVGDTLRLKTMEDYEEEEYDRQVSRLDL